jgi:chemotaxis protein methyltransferase CheR
MIELKEHEHAEIAGYIKAAYGVALDSKGSLIEGRLGIYIASRGFETFSDYFKFALNDPSGEEITNMINRLTTNHTYFMRENDHFEFITAQVLPWVESLPDGRDLRIWSAGCATGEEPYGL